MGLFFPECVVRAHIPAFWGLKDTPAPPLQHPLYLPYLLQAAKGARSVVEPVCLLLVQVWMK